MFKSILLTIVILLTVTIGTSANQERYYGIKWEVPDSESLVKKELTHFQQTGITHLLISEIIPYNVMDVLSAYDFKITVQLPFTYLTEDELVDRLPEIVETFRDYSIYYNEFPDVNSFSLFYVADIDQNLADDLYSAFLELQADSRFEVTYVQIPDLDSDKLLNYEITPIWLTGASSGVQHNDSLKSLSHLLFSNLSYSYSEFSRYTEHASQGLLLIPDSYYWSGLEADLPIDSVITSTIKEPDKLFDRSSVDSANEYPNLIIFSLVITILIFGVHYGFEPNYRKSLSRYFGAHIFFVDDIGERRIRLGTSLLLVMLVQALLFAIAKTFFLQYTLSPLQHEILTHHLPWLTFASTTFIGSLILNGVIMLLFMLICGLWIYLAFPTLQQIYQSFLLFLWPLHLAIPVVFLYVISVLTGISEVLSASLLVLYLIIVFGSFVVTFFDMLRIERKASLVSIYLTTFIPYLAILSVMLIYLFPAFYIYDLIGMIFLL